MPRYFFHIFDGIDSPDLDGTLLPDIYTAHTEAVRLSGELLRDIGGRFWDGAEWRLEVADERGEVLFVLKFSAEERGEIPAQRPDSDAA